MMNIIVLKRNLVILSVFRNILHTKDVQSSELISQFQPIPNNFESCLSMPKTSIGATVDSYL